MPDDDYVEEDVEPVMLGNTNMTVSRTKAESR